jgi:hypothetical protein
MELWKKTETTGCEMEDGSDTRTSNVRFMIIEDDEKENFNEYMANDYGNTDYSYQVNYKLILNDVDDDDLEQLKKAIKYYDEKGKARTYSPDFIINNEVIEIKPEKLKNVSVNLKKFEAGRLWCEENNYQYKVITPNYLSDDVIYNMWQTKQIIFNNRVEQKAIKYFKKVKLLC